MTDRGAAARRPPAPDLSWEDYEDVTPLAQRCSIKYPVLLDARVKSLLEQDVDPVEFVGNNGEEPLAIFCLVPLRFLLDRFPSMTRFRYSFGPGRQLGYPEKIPVIATFHEDDQRGYFVALTLDVNGVKLDQ